MNTPNKTPALPEALRLANWIDSPFDPDDMHEFGLDQIAAELRRLHAITAAIKDATPAPLVTFQPAIDLLKEARQHLPLAALSWNNSDDRQMADYHTPRVLQLIKRIDDVIAAGQAEGSRPAKPPQEQPQCTDTQAEDWVLVPRVPTEEMIVHGFESRPSISFSTEEAWAEFEAMTGCQQAAHCARLCWDAMIQAAPAPAEKTTAATAPATFEEFARTTAPWLLEEPETDADRLQRTIARKAYEAGQNWRPQFDVMVPKQEELAIQFCTEIVGRRGEGFRGVDPVRLLEMAQELYEAEREGVCDR